jgi:uncharacterized surface protein with fasciclin (FAS1) repeats
VKVSDGCAYNSNEKCSLEIIVYGQKCPDGNGCKNHGQEERKCAGPTLEEDGIKDCLTQEVYFTGDKDEYYAELAEDDKDIVDIALSDPQFSTLVAALKAADLVSTLQGDGPFTVFAPTNDAFDALPDGTLDDLLKPENVEKLKAILLYHVVGSQVESSDLSDGAMLDTVEGSSVTAHIDDDGVKINDANVIKADVEASNGVIHVIDAVLLPPEKKKEEEPPITPLKTGDSIVDIALADPDKFSTLV